MLTLADASAFFDRTPVLDPLTGDRLFYGQMDPYDDSKRDSATAYRRVLSVKPGTPMPASRTVRIFGAVWLVGGKEVDGLDVAHRDKYVLHPATAQFSIRTLAEHLAGTAGTPTWGDREWVKYGKETAVSSRPVPLYNLYLPVGVAIAERQIAWDGVEALLISSVGLQPSGVQAALGELLGDPVATATVSSNVYDPAAGSYTAGSTVSVPCLQVRWQALYEYDSQADAKYQEGDTNFVVPLGTAVDNSTVVTLGGVAWRVLSVEELAGVLVVHGRLR